MRRLLWLLSIVLVVTAVPSAASTAEISTDPPAARALRNPIEMTVTLTLPEAGEADLDWRRARIVIDGNDLSERLRPLLEGANAVQVAGEQFVFADRTLVENKLQWRIYGFTAGSGPHQVLVEVPRVSNAPPLRYQAQFFVLK